MSTVRIAGTNMRRGVLRGKVMAHLGRGGVVLLGAV